METLSIKRNHDETRRMVKYAFEQTEGIRTYYDNGDTIVGKTKYRLGSYGESVTVSFHDVDEQETMITVTSDREVSINITANPQRYEERFIRSIIDIKNTPHIKKHDLTKEVYAARKQADGSVMLFITFLIILAITMFIIFAPIIWIY